MSITVCKRVKGLCKGSGKRLEVLKKGIVGVRVQGLKIGGFYTGLYSHL